MDNEPEPFWTGHDAAERVLDVAQDVPSEAGRLVPAGSVHNGSSGRVLDEMYLRVLGFGIDRDACWITDLHQTYLANAGQLALIRSSYDGWVARGVVRPANLPARRGPFRALLAGREETLRAELEEASPELVITLGAEPLACLEERWSAVAPPESLLDVDTPADLELARRLADDGPAPP